MIRVSPQPEPDQFNDLVRKPGKQFLRVRPRPTLKDFKGKEFWRRILPRLHDSYHGICAYACHWIPPDTGFDTVEHFKAKTLYPKEAYEWFNFRLVCGTLNGRKGKYRDVIDPFDVQDGEFVLDFPSLEVKPAAELKTTRKKKIQKTIDRLKLNDEGTCLKARIGWLKAYCDSDVTFHHLQRHAPFIAIELIRQGLETSIKQIMNTLPS